MEDIRILMQKASACKESRDIDGALSAYNDAFNILIERAAAYAREQESQVVDLQALRAMTPALFAHSDEYLKRDLTAAIILNEMGLLFQSQKEYENAQQKFSEATRYIPDGEDFADPQQNYDAVTEIINTSIVSEPELFE